eukprot:TRINITY_DN9400_c0_g1_i4.p1 TRINITY_DN9400_c0_g1~~TRINITY_DN9400_c0_g1_i4.p1  ORF type:complete len:212 (-),score=54.25 TRINITY_DN9400_c0_g1_i4:155-718(-)
MCIRDRYMGKAMDMTQIIVPYGNMGDFFELSPLLRDGLTVYFVKEYKQVYNIIFENGSMVEHIDMYKDNKLHTAKLNRTRGDMDPLVTTPISQTVIEEAIISTANASGKKNDHQKHSQYPDSVIAVASLRTSRSTKVASSAFFSKKKNMRGLYVLISSNCVVYQRGTCVSFSACFSFMFNPTSGTAR